MEKSIFLENTENAIKRQMKWAKISNQEDRDAFLSSVIKYCERLMSRPFKQLKSAKTRQGSGKK